MADATSEALRQKQGELTAELQGLEASIEAKRSELHEAAFAEQMGHEAEGRYSQLQGELMSLLDRRDRLQGVLAKMPDAIAQAELAEHEAGLEQARAEVEAARKRGAKLCQDFDKRLAAFARVYAELQQVHRGACDAAALVGQQFGPFVLRTWLLQEHFRHAMLAAGCHGDMLGGPTFGRRGDTRSLAEKLQLTD